MRLVQDICRYKLIKDVETKVETVPASAAKAPVSILRKRAPRDKDDVDGWRRWNGGTWNLQPPFQTTKAPSAIRAFSLRQSVGRTEKKNRYGYFGHGISVDQI